MHRHELRIGNVVQSCVNHRQQRHTTSRFLYRIAELKTFKANVDGIPFILDSTHLEYGDIEGVRLTKDWIERLGLESHKNDTLFTKSIHEQLRKVFIIAWYPGAGEYVTGFDRIDKKEIELLPLRIKYVHQLQNLYFALTNEELICAQVQDLVS